VYKLCGKCGYRTDKCKDTNNVNYDDFRNYFDVCSNKKVPYEQRESKNKERELKHLIRHGDDDI
jgi:hypothetical protein